MIEEKTKTQTNINTATKPGKPGLTPEDQNQKQNPVPVPDPDINTDIVDNMEFNVKELANKFINTELENPEDIYNNNGLFVLMLKYIYKCYIKDILNNNTNTTYHRYNYRLLDKLFWIYTDLVYKYKKNTRPNILEFCVFLRISRETIYNGVKGYVKKLTKEDIDIIKTWFNECESSLVNGSSVFEIFLLKSQYGYNDNLQSVPLELQNNVLTPESLPDLSGNVSRIEEKKI